MVVGAAARTVVQTTWLGGGVRRLCTRKGWTNPILHPDGYFHSESEARGMFEVWCKVYRKTYPSEEEKLFRYGCFREKLEFSTRRNHDYSPGGQCFGPNCFADKTDKECRALNGAQRPPDMEKIRQEQIARHKIKNPESTVRCCCRRCLPE